MQTKINNKLQLIFKVSLVVAMIPMTQAQEPSTETSSNPSTSPSIEEIQVFGIRRSLESALEEKRFTTNLTEIINADDIGKLPDENVAEVLENIPGVQITRDKGIGAEVSVRGSDQNRIEINGRGTSPSADSRGGISFADLPAALVRSLHVVKVPTADMVEGSLGGTIDVKTYRGLKLQEPLRVVRLTSEYAENADAWNENFSATLGNKFEESYGDIGAILTISHIDKSIRQDSLRINPNVRRPDAGSIRSTMDFDGDGDFDPYFFPGYTEQNYQSEDRQNSALAGSIEWQARENLKLFFDGSYTDFHRQGNFQQVSTHPLFSRFETNGLDEATFGVTDLDGTPVPVMTSGEMAGGTRPNGQPDGMLLRTQAFANNRDTQSHVIAAGGEWFNEDLEIKFEASNSASDSTSPLVTTNFTFNDPLNPNFLVIGGHIRVPLYFNALNGVPAYGPVEGAQGNSVANGVVTAHDLSTLLDPSYYALFLFKEVENTYTNDLSEQKIDFNWMLDHKFWSDVSFGIRFSQRSNERERQSQLTSRHPRISASQFLEAFPGFLIETPGDFFDFNTGANYIDSFLTADPRMVMSNREAIRDFVSLDTQGTIDPLGFYKIDEDTAAIYIKGDFNGMANGGLLDGISYSGNIGVRLIDTDQTVTGTIDNETLNVTQKYRKALPSASFVISPTDKTQIRFGYAKILRRPNFSELSPTMALPLNIYTAAQSGNPELQPTTADQYDLALEIYFRRGSVLSLGYFMKDLDGVIGKELFSNSVCNTRVEQNEGEGTLCTAFNGEQGVLVDAIKTANLPGGKIRGGEVALQHNFNNLPQPFNGFGMIANYAYQKGDRDLPLGMAGFLQADGISFAEYPLNFQRLSENSYNLTLYFEKPRYKFSGRIRYTYRDYFLVTESSDAANTFPLYTDNKGQLNASMSYRINDMFTATMSANNLTDEQVIQPGIFPGGPTVKVLDPGRRFGIGIRARF